MNSVLIFQHIDCEDPGYLGSFLDSHHISYKVIRIDQGQQVPDSLNVAGLVFMGECLCR